MRQGKLQTHLLGLLNPLDGRLLSAGLLPRTFLNLSQLLFVELSNLALLITAALHEYSAVA